MSLRAKQWFVRRALMMLALLAVAAVAAPVALAQSSDEPTPKVEIFAGYAWMDPGGEYAPGVPIRSISSGVGTSATFNVDHQWGLTVDFGAHWGPNSTIYTFMAGPQFKWRREHISPFVRAMVGLHNMKVLGNGVGLSAGGGLDIHVNRWLDVRLIEADYVYAHHSGDLPIVGPARVNLSGGRLRSGLVFKLGGEPPVPASCSVSAQPMEVMTGEPVTATANAANFKPGRTLSYTWTASGGKVSGTGATASVDTAGLAAGSYNVGVQVSDGKKATASCSGNFMVKEPPKNPPQLSCSANPATVQSGEASTISCTCTSPDNRSVTIGGWSANAGTLSGSGSSATLDTAGLGSGAVSVNTTCTDDRGLSDATTTMVNVEAPPPPPQASQIGECDFATARVDNACKAVLDDVALRLQRDADSRAVIVGYTGPRENKATAARRATNAKAYLVKEKGIDASRIELRTGMDGGKKAAFIIVPAGATFDEAGTEMVMEKK